MEFRCWWMPSTKQARFGSRQDLTWSCLTPPFLGFTGQDARNSRTLMIIRPYSKRRESLGFYDKSVVTGLRPAFFEAHDEGSAAQKALQKALGQGVLVHPVGGASFTDRRKFRNFLRIAQSVWFDAYPFQSLTLVWAGNDLGRCEPTELLAAVQAFDATLNVASQSRLHWRLQT